MFQLTRFSHNTVFFRNQNARYAGTRCSNNSSKNKKGDNIQQKMGVLVGKYPLNSQKWPSRMVPKTSTYKFQGWKYFSMPDQPIHKISYCLQANNWELLHMQHHGKVTSFPSWNLPMLFWFYDQDRYLSCSRTILGSRFHP